MLKRLGEKLQKGFFRFLLWVRWVLTALLGAFFVLILVTLGGGVYLLFVPGQGASDSLGGKRLRSTNF